MICGPKRILWYGMRITFPAFVCFFVLVDDSSSFPTRLANLNRQALLVQESQLPADLSTLSQSKLQRPKYRRSSWPLIPSLVTFMGIFSTIGRATMTSTGGDMTKTRLSPAQSFIMWGALFLLSASLHSAESAITKLSTWKVQQLVDQEGQDSPFAILLNKMTSLLSTILITTTACSIYRYSHILFVLYLMRMCTVRGYSSPHLLKCSLELVLVL
jgi:hypothetical protein